MRQKIFLSTAVFYLLFFPVSVGIGFASDAVTQKDPEPSSEKSPSAEIGNTNFNKPLSMETFVVETNEDMASESLDRISGHIDTGFSAPENTYKSEDQKGIGPFAKEKAEEDKQRVSKY